MIKRAFKKVASLGAIYTGVILGSGGIILTVAVDAIERKIRRRE